MKKNIGRGVVENWSGKSFFVVLKYLQESNKNKKTGTGSKLISLDTSNNIVLREWEGRHISIYEIVMKE